MAQTSSILAEGRGWRITDVRCTASPSDPAFEEQHGAYCMAIVAAGTFGYRSAKGRATLAPGAVLLGNAGECFRCHHDHGAGDRCLSLHFTPEYFERIVAGVPGARTLALNGASLPPRPGTISLEILASLAGDAPEAFEERAVEFAGSTVARLQGVSPDTLSFNARQARKMAEVARLIDADAQRNWQLGDMAEAAVMSPYHFLRAFRAQIGITPYQFLLNRRLRNAALQLVETDEPVLAVALGCGFNDVSEFNRRFRRTFGQSPSGFRLAHSPRRSRTALGN
jgi:AraC family transcriptional regulator